MTLIIPNAIVTGKGMVIKPFVDLPLSTPPTADNNNIITWTALAVWLMAILSHLLSVFIF